MKRIHLSNLIESNDIFQDIFKKQSDRTAKTDNYYVYFAGITGINDMRIYCDFLANIKDKTSKYKSQYLLFKEKIPFSAVPDRVNDILALINDINFEEIQNSSLKIVDNEELNTRLKNALSVIYELAKKNNLLKTPSIEINFVVKMIVWIQDNLKDIVWKLEDNPKVFYFGKIKEHEALFLFLLLAVGFDVVYLNPAEDPFEKYTFKIPIQKFVYDIQNSNINATFDFFANQGKVVNKITSPTKIASEELKESFFTSESGIFKPFQFVKGNTLPLLINGTIEDLEVYFHQPAKVRPGFHIQNENTVVIPNFFFKINGVNLDRVKYFSLINDLRKSKNTLFASTVNIAPISIEKSRILSLDSAIDKNKKIIKEELRLNPLYRIKNIRFELEEFILSKIEETINTPIFKFKLENNNILHFIASVIFMDSKVLSSLETFDFTQNIPKIVIYTSHLEDMNIESAFLFAFLNRVGFDIVIFNTAGGGSIENYIDDHYFNTIFLEEFVRNLPLKSESELKEPSIIKKIFNI
ncbi:YceG family protein [Sebaldella termitidis]|uniref:YceG family protein n=1 Tax=Sebaldella termitidis TaxID=826 RepID=UPI003EBB23B0